MKRLTEKRNGKNVIPLRNAICGLDLPYWSLDRHNEHESFISGEAADKLAAYEDRELKPEDIDDVLYRFSCFLCEMTNNRMSKTNYTLEAMIECARDAQEDNCERYCYLKKAELENEKVAE